MLKQSGGWSLRDEGIALALSGASSLDEILRVTHDDDALPPTARKTPDAMRKEAA